MLFFVKKNNQDSAKNILFKQEVNDEDEALTEMQLLYVVETKQCSSLCCMNALFFY